MKLNGSLYNWICPHIQIPSQLLQDTSKIRPRFPIPPTSHALPNRSVHAPRPAPPMVKPKDRTITAPDDPLPINTTNHTRKNRPTRRPRIQIALPPTRAPQPYGSAAAAASAARRVLGFWSDGIEGRRGGGGGGWRWWWWLPRGVAPARRLRGAC